MRRTLGQDANASYGRSSSGSGGDSGVAKDKKAPVVNGVPESATGEKPDGAMGMRTRAGLPFASADAHKAGGGFNGDIDSKELNTARTARELLGEDGLPDWSILTRRVVRLAKEAPGFKAAFFLENEDTDTQAGHDRATLAHENTSCEAHCICLHINADIMF